MFHQTVSRREFLKWTGAGVAGAFLHAGPFRGFSPERAAPADASSLALQINGDGVIFDGPFQALRGAPEESNRLEMTL